MKRKKVTDQEMNEMISIKLFLFLLIHFSVNKEKLTFVEEDSQQSVELLFHWSLMEVLLISVLRWQLMGYLELLDMEWLLAEMTSRTLLLDQR